jgi:hypothetical protein
MKKDAKINPDFILLTYKKTFQKPQRIENPFR